MISPAIGIDLGTTFSCAAVYRKAKGPEIISDENGDRIIPSLVYYDPVTGNVLVGKNAVDEIPDCPQNGLFDAKRIIGRQFDDQYISKFVDSTEIPFSLVRAENDMAAYEITIAGKRVIKTPEEVSAEVLKYMKRTAETHTGCNVTEAVISIPAYFSNAQRRATRRAAKLAGFDVLKLIAEPTAAAIHYVSDKERENSNILVFDLGGGTCDVSIIKIIGKRFEVKAVYGNTFLGGRDIDKILFTHFKQFCLKNQKALTDTRKRIFLRRLFNASVELKKKLTTQSEARKSVPSPFGGDEDIFLTMSRAKFEELTSDLFEQAFEIVKICLYDCGISKCDIDEVVLVGGSVRIPIIRRIMSNYFGEYTIKSDVHPDEAIAAGASLQAALLKSISKDLERYTVSELTPLSLGIETRISCMSVFIPKYSQLPFKIKEKFNTLTTNQTSVRISIFEGERRNVIHNNLLGEFIITGLPPGRAGDVIYYIIFELDEDGILSVTAAEDSTGISKKLVVTMGQFRLSDKKVKITLDDAKRHKDEDEKFVNYMRLMGEMELSCYQIIHDINKISSTTDKELVKQRCGDFIRFCDNIDTTAVLEIDKLESRFAALRVAISSILEDNDLLQLIKTPG